MPTSPAAISRLLPQPRELLHGYLDRIAETERRGGAREESFYPHLKQLFEGYAEHRGWRDLEELILPRKTQDCLFDFQVRRGEWFVGYIEAKRPEADLGALDGSPQLKRYRAAFPNLLLTNFPEMRLYRGDAAAARANVTDGPEPVLALLDLFCDFAPPAGSVAPVSAAELAPRMALRTRILAARLRELLKADPEGTSDLSGFYRAFSEHLLAGLKPPEFADLYAQTLAYGLLAARWRAPGAFDRR